MSQMQNHDLACPECGREQEVMVLNSINVTIDPQLRDRLFDADINVFRCRYCSYNAFLNAPLLYHDMGRKFCVQFYPPELLEDESFLESFSKDGKSDEPMRSFMKNGPGRYLMEPQIVFDMMEMIRQIRFRESLYEKFTGERQI